MANKHNVEGCAENCPFFFEDTGFYHQTKTTALCGHPKMENEREIPLTEGSVVEPPSWCELRKEPILVQLNSPWGCSS